MARLPHDDYDFRFPIVKLLDYRERLSELEHSRNPVASLVLTHLAAQRTRRDPLGRLQSKLAITRRLYDLGYTEAQIREAFGFVDWLLRLPDALRVQFVQELRTFEQERQMTYTRVLRNLVLRKGAWRDYAKGLRWRSTLNSALRLRP